MFKSRRLRQMRARGGGLSARLLLCHVGINVEVSAQAACLNPGGSFPQAANKQTVTAEGVFPVQNGKANFSLTLTATFQPKCSPPMTVVFGPVTITVSDTSFAPFSTTISGPGPGGTF